MKYRLPAIFPAVLRRCVDKLERGYYAVRSPLLSWLWGVSAESRVRYYGRTLLRTHGKEIKIGKETTFVSNESLNLVGLTGPTILDTLNCGRIVIGERCGFSSVVISSKTRVVIGDRVLAGGNVRIFDHDYHAVECHHRADPVLNAENIRTKPVVIEDDCFIGTNAIILKGTHLGARTIVAAGSVVFGLDVPPDSLVKGNPAVICSREKS